MFKTARKRGKVKQLFVGDPHVKVSNLKDSQKLLDYIAVLAEEHSVKRIVFLGDQYDTHAVMRVEVQDFWDQNTEKLTNICEVLYLIGNHDMQGSKEKSNQHSMQIFRKWVDLPNKLILVKKDKIVDGIAYVSYKHSEQEFLKAAHDLYDQGGTKLLVAHQTFTGAQYDNGFFAPDGIDPILVPQDAILSGHVHKKQQIGKCLYPGTAKWDSISDANEDKGLHIVTHREDGSVEKMEFFSTKNIVSPIYKFVLNEGDKELDLDVNARNYIELCGQAAWITKMKKKYKGFAQIKAKPTDRKVVKTDKDNLQSIGEYLNKCFTPINGVSKIEIDTYLRSMSE